MTDYNSHPCFDWYQVVTVGNAESDFERELRNVHQRRADFHEDALRALIELFGAPRELGPCASFDVGADARRAAHNAAAEFAAQALVTVKRRVQVSWSQFDRAREAPRIERGLGDAHADVRARDEGRIPKECDRPAAHVRRLEVVDRLE